MRWVGKHKVFQDLMIGGVLLTPPDPTYEYELTLPNDDGSAGQVLSTDGSGVLSWVANGVAVPNALTAGTGIDYNTGSTWDGSVAKTISVDVSDFMTNGVNDRVVTATGTDAMNAEAQLTYNSALGGLNMWGSSGGGAFFSILENVDNSSGATIRLKSNRGGAAAQDGDDVGKMEFQGVNDGTPASVMYGSFTTSINTASTGNERGKMEFKVAEYDGTLTSGLSLTGMDANGEIDVTIAAGAASTTAIAGELTLGADLAIAHGGTGASTAQAAIDALTAVSGASAGQRLTKDGSGNATWANATTGTTLNGTTVNGIATYASANTLDIEPNLTWNGNDFLIESGASGKPYVEIRNIKNDIFGPYLVFNNTKGGSTAGAPGDIAGLIQFYAVDALNNTQQYGEILSRAVTTTNLQEGGQMWLRIASHDGTLVNGLELEEGSVSGEVDVNIGTGTSSITTTAGDLTVSGDRIQIGDTVGTAASFTRKDATGSSYHGGDLTIEAGKPQAGIGANKNAGDLILKSGMSTGTGDPGKVEIYTNKEWGSSSGSGYNVEKVSEFSNPGGLPTFKVLDTASDYIQLTATASYGTIETANSGGNSDLIITPENDLKLRATSKQIKFGTPAGGGTDVVHWDMNNDNYKFMSTADLNDYFNINIGADAETTLSTVENGGGSTAHFNVVADGNIDLASVGDTTIDAGAQINLDTSSDVVLQLAGSTKGAFKLSHVGPGCEITGLHQVVIDLNQAQLNLIATANGGKGYPMIPALGSGLVPIVIGMNTYTAMPSGIQNTVAQDFFLEYDDGVLKDLNQCIMYQRRFMHNMGTSGYQRLDEWRMYRGWQSVKAPPDWINKAVYLSASANPTPASYTSMRVMITYHVVKF